jgi:hypothetical protein
VKAQWLATAAERGAACSAAGGAAGRVHAAHACGYAGDAHEKLRRLAESIRHSWKPLQSTPTNSREACTAQRMGLMRSTHGGQSRLLLQHRRQHSAATALRLRLQYRMVGMLRTMMPTNSAAGYNVRGGLIPHAFTIKKQAYIQTCLIPY